MNLCWDVIWYITRSKWYSSIWSILSSSRFLVNCRDHNSDCELAWCWLCQVVGGVVSHSAAGLILLWGGFLCQEAPAWPPAHQPHLAPAYWHPTTHALPLRVGERRLAALARIHFGRNWCPHTLLSEVLTAVENIKGLRALLLPLVACRLVVEMLSSIWRETALFNIHGLDLTVHPVSLWFVLLFWMVSNP